LEPGSQACALAKSGARAGDQTYHGRVRKVLSFSNVMSVIAVFIALGGTAVALRVGRNTVGSTQLKAGSVRSTDIGNRQVRPIDTARSLGFDCPAGTRYVTGVCIEQATNPPADQPDAEEVCFRKGRRLPAVAELQMARFAGMTLREAGEWSSDYLTFRDPQDLWGVLVTPSESFTRIAPRFAALFPYRCVAPPRR
jgi:hypothetical protein